jgi:hypothetical protein
LSVLYNDYLPLQVETVFSTDHPDPVEMERAKKVLKVKNIHMIFWCLSPELMDVLAGA